VTALPPAELDQLISTLLEIADHIERDVKKESER
jgi:hypothetical protein